MRSEPRIVRTLLIFDLDGTLYDTRTSFLPTLRRVFTGFQLAYPGDAAVMARVGDTFGTFLDWLIGLGVPASSQDLARQIAELEFASIRAEGALFPDVSDTLHELRRRGCTLALCTNGDRPYTNAVLGKFHLLPLFAAIRTHGDEGLSKPRMVRDLLDRFRPQQAHVVGDRGHDFDAARASRCGVIAVAYGFADDWRTADADVVLHRFGDLLSTPLEAPRAAVDITEPPPPH